MSIFFQGSELSIESSSFMPEKNIFKSPDGFIKPNVEIDRFQRLEIGAILKINGSAVGFRHAAPVGQAVQINFTDSLFPDGGRDIIGTS